MTNIKWEEKFNYLMDRINDLYEHKSMVEKVDDKYRSEIDKVLISKKRQEVKQFISTLLKEQKEKHKEELKKVKDNEVVLHIE